MERTSQKGIDSVLRIQRRGCTPLQHPNGVALFGCGREGTLSDLAAGTCDYSVLFVSTSIVYKKNPPLKNHVFNFRKFLRGWHAEDEPQCPGCQGLFTGTVFRSSGHMFATLSSVLPSIFLGHINLSDSVFPTYNQWMENAQDQFHR